MIAMLRQFRRAPGRIVASVLALALAVGAIGVLAIPRISEGSLHAAVERDGLGDIVATTSPLDDAQLARIAALPGVRSADGATVVAARVGDRGVQLVGLADGRSTDLLRMTGGREPELPGEVVVSGDVASIGDTITVDGLDATVVGTGSTLWYGDVDAVYADLDDVQAVAADPGVNRLTVVADDDSERSLDALVDRIRSELAATDATFTDFPVTMPDGSTPIDADIRQVSTLIGLLGVMAGLVALVLLASTTNTLITERTREVAVMRALGGRNRPLRRRLRRIAIGITVAALVIGLPLGVFISNLIARMVLEKFVGLTPDVAVDWRVLAGSAVGALLGARLVAGRAARRVTRQPLAAALRDREGAPYGARWYQRLLARTPVGGLLDRVALRASLRRPGRTVAVVAQIAAAVGAAFLVPSLVASVNEYNSNAYSAWTWEARAIARDPGLPFAQSLGADDPSIETGISSWGSIDDWDVEVVGMAADTTMFDAELRDGRRFVPGAREALVSAGFAERRGIDVGDTVELELASGTVGYEVVGLADDFGRTLYADRGVLAADLGAPGHANVVWSSTGFPDVDVPVAVAVDTRDAIAAAEGEGRDAIAVIFGAIGAIVAGVAALAVMSSMVVSLFERRHELAAMQALGARRRRLRSLLVRELVPLGAIGTALGLGLGALGTRAIIGSFEASNAVDIGVVDALGAIPFVVGATMFALVGLALVVVRSAGRRPVAVTLRGAA